MKQARGASQELLGCSVFHFSCSIIGQPTSFPGRWPTEIMLLTLCFGGKEICPSFWLAVKEESNTESVGTPEGLDHRIQGHEGSRYPLLFPCNGLAQSGINCGHC